MNHEELKELQISLNGEDISDVIQRENGMYKNLMTRRRSCQLSDVTRARDFIITEKKELYGYYAKIYGDSLVVVTAKLYPDGTWRETPNDRLCFNRDFTSVGARFKEISCNSAVDICGKTPIEGESFPVVCAGRSKEAARKFFGRYLVLEANGQSTPFTFDNWNDYIIASRAMSERPDFTDGTTLWTEDRIIYITNKDGYKAEQHAFKTLPFPMPKKAEEALEAVKERWSYNPADNHSYNCFNIIQSVDGKPLMRRFVLSTGTGDEPVCVSEYERVMLDEAGPKKLQTINLTSTVIYVDDILGYEPVKYYALLFNNNLPRGLKKAVIEADNSFCRIYRCRDVFDMLRLADDVRRGMLELQDK